MIKVAMFDTKTYDEESFRKVTPDDIDITYFPSKLNKDTARLADGMDAVITFVNDTVDADTIDVLAEEGVRLVALRCAGFDSVDVEHAMGKLHVVRVPAYSPEAVAEHAFAMLLTSVRRIHKAYIRTRDFNFSLDGLVGFNLNGKTVGVIGTGKIGKAFIRIANGFGMNVLAYDKFPAPDVDATYVEMDELLEKSDIISLHCPLTDENRHLIGAESIEKMKKGVIIVNTSRGALVDAKALIEGIKSRKIGGALIDVYEEEGSLFFSDKSGHILDDDTMSRLLSMPNVIVSSHQAFLTNEALANIADTTLSNIKLFFDKNELPNEVCYHCSKIASCQKDGKRKCF